MQPNKALELTAAYVAFFYVAKICAVVQACLA